ncbi:SprT family zinc-dependent metalloprotease [Ramlibacter sp. 2FC]|uniref:M48 family metallopeptidase n=1 Tax=Ramlibacter sp. 2FC TaxID=2502188 RepID=UPI0010F82C8E|nr:SprT family zinc-dependent metalloprotease [Ramlibacter sp. 2FC]
MRRLLQLTLDLFDPPAPPVPPAAPSAPAEARPGPPAEALAPLIAPVRFAHPRANRELALAEARIAYAFRRGQRRTIGFSVGPDGLVVSAPRWTPLPEVEAALREKSGWILRKLGEAHERQQKLAMARIAWCDGATLPYLGEPLLLALAPRQASGAGTLAQAGGPGLPPTLQIGLPSGAAPEQIRDAAQAWLMRQARRLFTERLDHFAPQLGVQWRKLSLSNAGTRWGSARSDGSIRLNWRLVHLRLPVIDYVVAHELAHLRVMDHSPRFWDAVGSVMPDYAERRGQLREAVVPPW